MINTTIFAASLLHSRSVKLAAIPAVTASGPSPPPDASVSSLSLKGICKLTVQAFQIRLNRFNVRCKRVELGDIGVVLRRVIPVVDDLMSVQAFHPDVVETRGRIIEAANAGN